MWRRLSSHLQTLAPRRSLPKPSRFVSGSAVSPSPLRRAPSCFSRYFSSDSDSAVSKEKKRIEDVMPIATGHEREELEAELEGRNILDINYPAGPFGTKGRVFGIKLEIAAFKLIPQSRFYRYFFLQMQDWDFPHRDVILSRKDTKFMKESPAVVKSVYNKRIVGCPGGEGEDEHDVVWFWLEKDKPHECPVCSQYFVLEVVGAGGDPDGHDDHH